MGNVTSPLLPKTQRLLSDLGSRLKLARLRRGLAAKQVAERAGMAPLTLRSIERGSSTVTFGAYIAVMQVLGLVEDLNLLAKEDETGRHIQDAKLIQTKPRKESKGNYESNRSPAAYMPVEEVNGTYSPPAKRKRTRSAGSQASPPEPAKQSAPSKKAVRTPAGPETAASRLAAQIFKDGGK